MIGIRVAEKEKGMYGICSMILVMSVLVLSLISLKGPQGITGNVILDSGRNFSIKNDGLIDYKNISLENITQEIALNAILQAGYDLEEMKEQGFEANWANDTLIEAKKYFEGQDYTILLKEIEKISDKEKRGMAKELLLNAQQKIGKEVDYKKVLELTMSIVERKEKSYEIKDVIRASELMVQDFKSQGLDTGEADKILMESLEEFKNGRLEKSQEKLETIDTMLIELSGQTTLVRTIYKNGKANIINFLKENYKIMLLFLGSLLAILVLLYNRIMIAILRHDVRGMDIEKDVVLGLIKNAQSEYYAKNSITRQTFDIKISKYKENLAEINEKLPIMKDTLKKRLSSKRVL